MKRRSFLTSILGCLSIPFLGKGVESVPRYNDYTIWIEGAPHPFIVRVFRIGSPRVWFGGKDLLLRPMNRAGWTVATLETDEWDASIRFRARDEELDIDWMYVIQPGRQYPFVESLPPLMGGVSLEDLTIDIEWWGVE